MHAVDSQQQPGPFAPDRKSDSGTKINCICAGAIENTSDDSAQSLESMDAVLVCSIDCILPQAILEANDSVREIDADDDSRPYGRALRAAISSLLC